MTNEQFETCAKAICRANMALMNAYKKYSADEPLLRALRDVSMWVRLAERNHRLGNNRETIGSLQHAEQLLRAHFTFDDRGEEVSHA